jgi:putative membrane protein
MTENIVSFIENKLAQTAERQPHAQPGDRSLRKGLVAGLIAGLAATAAKSAAERLYPPRTEGQPEPPAELANRLAGHELAPARNAVASESIHWAFGAAAGAAYGALAEFYPPATGREGINFGMTLMAFTHEGALPALGLAAAPAEQSSREKSSELVTHAVFGLVAEFVRCAVRKRL